MALDHYGQLPLPQTSPIEGSEGYISFKDREKPQRGLITVPVDSFRQMKAYMDYYTREPERYIDVRWHPNPKILKPFMEN